MKYCYLCNSTNLAACEVYAQQSYLCLDCRNYYPREWALNEPREITFMEQVRAHRKIIGDVLFLVTALCMFVMMLHGADPRWMVPMLAIMWSFSLVELVDNSTMARKRAAKLERSSPPAKPPAMKRKKNAKKCC